MPPSSDDFHGDIHYRHQACKMNRLGWLLLDFGATFWIVYDGQHGLLTYCNLLFVSSKFSVAYENMTVESAINYGS